MAAKLEGLGTRIRYLRMKAGLSQGDFANAGGFTQTQVSFWETGRAYPGLESAVKVTTVLGITLQELLEETPPQLRPPAAPGRAQKAIWILEEMNFTKPVIERVKLVLKDGSV